MQRHLKRKLDRGESSEGMTAARVTRLTALGLVWDPPTGNHKEGVWEDQLARLAAYKVAHGDCNVPSRWVEDPGLGNWVSNQRANKKALARGDSSNGRMTAARAAKLEALGFAWGLSAAVLSKRMSKVNRDDAGWEGWLAKLKQYKAEHGHCDVPAKWVEDPQLGGWVTSQRACKKLECGKPGTDLKGMTAERAARLTALGFAWDPLERDWDAQFARLAAYKAAHGDCSVSGVWAEDPPLGRWVNTQRVMKRQLDRGEHSKGMTAERAAQLSALGFVWNPEWRHNGSRPKDAAWEAQLARLVSYKSQHGDCNVPKGWAEDPRLPIWVSNQRSRKRRLDRGEPSQGMTAGRAARLMALGFTWSNRGTATLETAALASRGPGEAAWEVQLARLAAYKAEHDHCNVLRGWAEDPRLAKWVRNQREYKQQLDRGGPSHGMTVARAAKLEALGFEWNRPSGHRGSAKSPLQVGRPAKVSSAGAKARDTAATEPADQDVGATAPAGYPPGARVSRQFGDGCWYDGTVLEAPWPPGHRWAHWRRVRFDDGETHDVDTAHKLTQAVADGKPASKAAKWEPAAQPPAAAGRGKKRQKPAPGTAAPFMQLLH
jgi:hypothetical protein